MNVVNIALGDRTVRYWTEGHGAPLLYLHDFEGAERDAEFLSKLARQFTVFAPEHPGFGESDGLDDMRDITDLVLHYRQLIETLGLSRVNLVGHGLGGMFAAEVAALCPHRVDKLVLVDGYGLWLDAHPMPDPFVLSRRELAQAKWGKSIIEGKGQVTTNSDDAEQLEERFGHQRDADRQQSLGAATRFLWPLPDRGLDRRLAFIQAPTLILHGEHDGLVPSVYASALAERIPDARLTVIEDCGHLPMFQAESSWLRHVQDFLG